MLFWARVESSCNTSDLSPILFIHSSLSLDIVHAYIYRPLRHRLCHAASITKKQIALEWWLRYGAASYSQLFKMMSFIYRESAYIDDFLVDDVSDFYDLESGKVDPLQHL